MPEKGKNVYILQVRSQKYQQNKATKWQNGKCSAFAVDLIHKLSGSTHFVYLFVTFIALI